MKFCTYNISLDPKNKVECAQKLTERAINWCTKHTVQYKGQLFCMGHQKRWDKLNGDTRFTLK